MNLPTQETQLKSVQLAKNLALKTLEESTESVYYKISQINRIGCNDIKDFCLIFGLLSLVQKVEFMNKVRKLKSSEEKTFIMTMTVAYRDASPESILGFLRGGTNDDNNKDEYCINSSKISTK